MARAVEKAHKEPLVQPVPATIGDASGLQEWLQAGAQVGQDTWKPLHQRAQFLPNQIETVRVPEQVPEAHVPMESECQAVIQDDLPFPRLRPLHLSQ
ncbi:MAG: hypothetical protein HY718_15610, partial [Planctomycetes bacterium]|nr:hypothetical protein [Planctomycetota bacterium]